MKLLFWGTPEEAVPFLEVCAEEHEVLAVVTRADRPSGRGLEVRSSPVKQAAQRLKFPIWQPQNPANLLPEIGKLKPELSVVVAYGKILKPQVLASMKLGFVNVHFSLLPKFRGAAPIEWSLIRGESKSGVTLFWLDEGMDTGPVQSRSEIDVAIGDDAKTLTAKLIKTGVETLRETLRDVAQGRIRHDSQAGDATMAPKLTRADAKLDFGRTAVEFHNRVRGLTSGPRAFIQLKSGALTILKTALDDSGESLSGFPPKPEDGQAGRILRVERNKGILVQCSSGRIWIADVQPEGKKQIHAAEFINGLRMKPGDSFLS